MRVMVGAAGAGHERRSLAGFVMGVKVDPFQFPLRGLALEGLVNKFTKSAGPCGFEGLSEERPS